MNARRSRVGLSPKRWPGVRCPPSKSGNLFLYVANHANLDHRRLGLHELQKLDSERFMTILLATLEALPKTPKEPYWHCPEAAYAHLVLATDDPRAWNMLEKVAKRSDVGLRMQFLNPMNDRDVGGRLRQQRLDFLAAFLDDAEAPDVKANPEIFSGPHAGFAFARLTVQDWPQWKSPRSWRCRTSQIGIGHQNSGRNRVARVEASH